MPTHGLWREDEGCREFGAATRGSPLFEPRMAAQVLNMQQDRDKQGKKNPMKVLNMGAGGGGGAERSFCSTGGCPQEALGLLKDRPRCGALC